MIDNEKPSLIPILELTKVISMIIDSISAYYYTPHKVCLWWVYCFHVVRGCVHP